MSNPEKLKEVHAKLTATIKQNPGNTITKVLEKVVQELRSPFKDCRDLRYYSVNSSGKDVQSEMDKKRLFYLLIEESERTFKRGLIVTATVSKVLASMAICRLDNGLSAIVRESDLPDSSRDKKKL